MNIITTFDYEIFFGKAHGSVNDCLIKPTELLVEISKKNNVNLTFFVDIGYLIKLREYGKKFTNLENDFNNIYKQLKNLIKYGHRVQLHIHSHWEESFYDGENWNMDYSHYKLQSFSETEIFEIVKKYKTELEEITGQEIYVFRAGGWCIQPFEKIREPLAKNNILIDSSVIPNSFSDDYNFKESPQKSFWNFELDPNIENKNGSFLEVPISSIKISQLFYWHLLFTKVFSTKRNKTLGDGYPINPSHQNIIKWLLFGNYSVVSTDGLKSNLLMNALLNYEKLFSQEAVFTIIGHPKAITKHSIENIERFINLSSSDHNFITYDYFKEKLHDS